MVFFESAFSRRASLVLGAALAIASASALAQPSGTKAAGPSWNSLSAAQKKALAPLERDWSTIDADRKQKWIDIANRLPKMPPEEQQRVQARMADWARLSPAERGRARLSFQEAKQLSPQERQERWQAYQALPPEKREALAQPAAASQVAASTASRPGADQRKRNIVTNPSLSAAPGKAVAPTVVQANPGATTTLVNKPATPPAHQQPGMPKIAATPGFVDRNTLQPKRGAQGAAVRPAAVAPAGKASSPG